MNENKEENETDVDENPLVGVVLCLIVLAVFVITWHRVSPFIAEWVARAKNLYFYGR